MAQVIPSDLTRAALAGSKRPELDTLRVLKDTLPKDYTIFYGVHWTREYEACSHFGEITFVLLSLAGQVFSAGRLTFESVYRFKGQEAPAVIIVDVDPAPETPDRLTGWQRVLYCGMTSATVRLDVVKLAAMPSPQA